MPSSSGCGSWVDPVGPLDVRRVHDAGAELPGHQQSVALAALAAGASARAPSAGANRASSSGFREKPPVATTTASASTRRMPSAVVTSTPTTRPPSRTSRWAAVSSTQSGAEPAGRVEQGDQHRRGVGGVRARCRLPGRGVHLAVPHAVPGRASDRCRAGARSRGRPGARRSRAARSRAGPCAAARPSRRCPGPAARRCRRTRTARPSGPSLPPISAVFSSITAYCPASAAASRAAHPASPLPRTSTPTRSGSSVSQGQARDHRSTAPRTVQQCLGVGERPGG